MRRRLLASTLAIAVVCVLILGVPLAILARHQVWTSARDRLRERAAGVGTGLEDRLDVGQPVELDRFARLLPGRRIVVVTADGTTTVSGPPLVGPAFRSTVQVSDATVTVEAQTGPTAARARDVTLLVAGLSIAATCAAAFLGVWQARRLARPVANLVTRAEALGHGDFAADAVPSGVPEIDRVAQVLDRSARQLGTFVSLQQQFAADAAHQLRTPLTSIGLHLDEIAQLGGTDVQIEARDALAQVERLNGVITALLARARGDSAAPVVVDLGRLVTAAVSPWERLLRRQDRSLVLHVEPGVVVRVRKDHVVGVLGALLDNAVTHGAGEVTVTVASRGDAAYLEVCDEGAGVPVQLTDTLFDRRVSGSHGTGIGLALARSLVAAEGGTLTNRIDEPARFVVALPSDRGGLQPQHAERGQDERR